MPRSTEAPEKKRERQLANRTARGVPTTGLTPAEWRTRQAVSTQLLQQRQLAAQLAATTDYLLTAVQAQEAATAEAAA